MTDPIVAMGMPVAGPSVVAATAVDAVAAAPEPDMARLQRDGFPPGLAFEMHKSSQAFPLRIWVVDNSGSMNAGGGSRIVKSGGKLARVGATRWQELGDAVVMAATVSETLGARTDFQLLNPTPAGQNFSVCAGGGSHLPVPAGVACDVPRLKQVMGDSPRGTTPLTEAVEKILANLSPAADKLRAHGQQVVVVLATDGLPNDASSFLAALQRLQRLPVWMVVRLCTDEDSVVDYWSNLDRSLEAPLEVLDDLKGEAEEIAKVSPWITYGPPLHAAREFGCRNKLFDLLDETRLLPSQAKDLAELILGCGPLPEPEADPEAFLAALTRAQAEVPAVFHPIKGSAQPWFNVQKFGKMLKGGGGECVLC